jgi:hypothetical protein
MQSVMINFDVTLLEEEKCVSIGCENALLYDLRFQSAVLQNLPF